MHFATGGILWRAALASILASLSAGILAADPPAPPALRLGDAAAPRSYAAQLAIDPREPTFTGEIRIELEVTRAAPVLWLNASALTVETAELEQGSRKIALKVIPGGEDFVGLAPLEGSFAAGPAAVTLRYRGNIDSNSRRGVYHQQEGGEWYVLTQFEAISARYAFPCFDEPGWKTPWRLTIDAPASNVVASNTPETSASDVPARPGWTRHAFAVTKPLPTYLVALAVGPFEVVDGGTAGTGKVALRYLTPKGRASEARYAREVTPRIVELLESYFGMPYPFEKLDSVSVPQGGGAMENAGLITYNTRFLLARPREETDANKRRYVSIAAHEIAHHWFGNYVTLAWWDDIWLNEAFATWMAEKILYEFNPAWDNGLDHASHRRRAIAADRLASSRRVKNPILVKGDIRGAFDSITYQKGGEVLSMFESSITPEKFRQGVRAFLSAHAYGSATSREFFAAMGEASGRGAVVEAFTAFVEQPGIPLIDAALKCDAGVPVLELSQHRLRPVGSSAMDLRWNTPACFRFRAGSTEATQCMEVREPRAEAIPMNANSCPAWLVGNPGGRGHYVVRYDEDLSRKIGANLKKIAAHEAVALLDDTAMLARSGLLAPDAALSLAEAGLEHPAPVVQLAAVQLLLGERDAWLTSTQLGKKRNIVSRRAVPLATRLGWIEKRGEGEGLRQLRAVVLPFAADSEAGAMLRPEARALALGWIESRDSLSADMVGPVLMTAARFADAPTFEKLQAALVEEQDQRDRHELLTVIAKVRDPGLRERAFANVFLRRNGTMVLNGGHVYDLLDSAMRDDASRAAAFDFMRANFDSALAKMPQDTFAWLLHGFAGLCTARERDVFREFFAARAGRFLGAELAYRQTLEEIELCVASRGGVKPEFASTRPY